MYEIHPIDFSYVLDHNKSKKHNYPIDTFRSTIKNDTLHVAQWLYSIDAHKYVPFGYSNVKDNLKRNVTNRPDYYEKAYEWLLSLEEFKK